MEYDFKPGDRVSIISKSKDVDELIQEYGAVVTIKKKINGFYTIEEDNGKYLWRSSVFEPYNEINIDEEEISSLFN